MTRTSLQRYNALVSELERAHPPTCPCYQPGPPGCVECATDYGRLATAFIAMPLWARAWTCARAGCWRDAIHEIRRSG